MAKNGSNHVNGRTVTLPDGRRVFADLPMAVPSIEGVSR